MGHTSDEGGLEHCLPENHSQGHTNYISPAFTLRRTFQPCHLTFLTAIYDPTNNLLPLKSGQHGQEQNNNSERSNKESQTHNLLHEDDIKQIQTFLKERETILALKEHAFKIGLMYEESLQFSLKGDPKRLNLSETSIPCDPLFSLSKVLKRQYSEAESHVTKATEPLCPLIERVQLRIERLEVLLKDSAQLSGLNYWHHERNSSLETQYKLELWMLLMDDLKSTLSCVRL